MVNPRKCYPVDTGLTSAVAFVSEEDVGHRLENAVYLALRRSGAQISYVLTRSGGEVDFLVERPSTAAELVQVAASLASPKVREREIQALAEAMSERRIGRATVVTLFEGGEESLPAGPARIVPAWRWLVDEALGRQQWVDGIS